MTNPLTNIIKSTKALKSSLSDVSSELASKFSGDDLKINIDTSNLTAITDSYGHIENAIKESTLSTDILDNNLAEISATSNTWADILYGIDNTLNDTVGSADRLADELNRPLATSSRLEDNVGDVGRAINNNISSQNRFNSALTESQSRSEGLFNTLKKVGTAYLGIQGIKGATELSDSTSMLNARLSLVVDEDSTVDEVKAKINTIANDLKMPVNDITDAFTKLDINAGKQFANDDEVLMFTDLVSKSLKVGGQGDTEQTAALYQLTQAMSAGKLQGDEYKSIIENAPLLARTIEDYMHNVMGLKGSFKDLASDGAITADVIKQALFSSADEINEKYSTLPGTFAGIANAVSNNFKQEFEPVSLKLNEIANSERMQGFIDKTSVGFSMLASVIVEVLDIGIATGNAIANNWDIIAPLIMGVVTVLGIYGTKLMWIQILEAKEAAIKGILAGAKIAQQIATSLLVAVLGAETAAQLGLNAAMQACPVVWIIDAIVILIAIFYSAIAVYNHFAGTSVSATGLIVGTICAGGAIIANALIGILEVGLTLIFNLVNAFVSFANFFGNVFTNPVSSIMYLFKDLGVFVLNTIGMIAKAIDRVFGSDLNSSVDGWIGSLESKTIELVQKVAPGEDYNKIFEEFEMPELPERFDVTNSFDFGNKIGESAEDKLLSFINPTTPEPYSYSTNGDTITDTLSGQNKLLSDIKDNTKKSSDKNEDMLAELREMLLMNNIYNVTNKQDVKVEIVNHNTIDKNVNTSDLLKEFTNSVTEAWQVAPNGGHL